MAAGGDEAMDPKRYLVVDEAAFEEQFLRCPICLEKYDQTEKKPKSLPCNHTFCLQCLKHVFALNRPNIRPAYVWADKENHEGVLICPTCRVELFVLKSVDSRLPNDYRVIQLIDFFSQVVVKSQNVCKKHERQPLNVFCKTCLVPVCQDCTVLDHKEQSEQVIVDVTQAIDDNSEQFNDARPTNDITQLFTVHKQMKEKESDFTEAAGASDDDLFISCKFEVENEPLFLSEMSCLGEVETMPDMELKAPVPAHQLDVLDMEERRKQEAAQEPDFTEDDDLR